MGVEGCVAERPRRLAAALVEHVADHNLGAGLDHQPRGFRADAARRARYQGNLAVETGHRAPPLLLSSRRWSRQSIRSAARGRAAWPYRSGNSTPPSLAK